MGAGVSQPWLAAVAVLVAAATIRCTSLYVKDTSAVLTISIAASTFIIGSIVGFVIGRHSRPQPAVPSVLHPTAEQASRPTSDTLEKADSDKSVQFSGNAAIDAAREMRQKIATLNDEVKQLKADLPQEEIPRPSRTASDPIVSAQRRRSSSASLPPPARRISVTHHLDDEPDWVRIRFVHINDVYTLENLPSLHTMLTSDLSDVGWTNLVVSIGGDLLSPYPLSALDQGRGMIDVLLQCGVGYAIFGNHEADVGLKALKARVKQWKQGRGVWLNTNMPDLLPELNLPRHTRVTGYSKNRQVERHVELLGVCSNDPGLYVATANFGGAISTAGDCNETALKVARQLRFRTSSEDNSPADAVVVFTHQDTEPDRDLADEGRDAGIYAVLGGHDHSEYLETHNGCVMAKAGADAHKAVVVDLLWKSPEAKEPEIDRMELLKVGEFCANKAVAKAANAHMEKIRAFDSLKGQMALTKFKDEPLVSSKGIREHQTEMGWVLCSALREELGVQCVLFDGGNIRGDRDYKADPLHHLGPQWSFTMADLEAEVPYASPMVQVMMRGDDIKEAVRWSRSRDAKFGGFLQTDRGLHTLPEDQAVVTHIDYQPLDESRWYRVGIMYNALVGGMNGNPVFTKWRETPTNIVPPADVGRPAKVLLLSYFARMTWKDMPPFHEMLQLAGCSEDSELTLEAIREAYVRTYPNHKNGADAMAQRLLAVADVQGTGKVSKEEIEALFPLPEWMTLMIIPPDDRLISSKKVREQQTSMGTLLCNALCKELCADCCLFDAGNIRGNKDYVPVPGHRRGTSWHFTLRDLHFELPWPSEMAVIQMTGKEISDAIRWSRSPSRSDKRTFPGFLQADANVRCEQDSDGEVRITQVAGKPLSLDSLYKVALIHTSLEGMNGNPIFAAWLRLNQIPPPGMSAESLVVRHYTRQLWAEMPAFEEIDTNKDGEIGWDELYRAVRDRLLHRQPSEERVKEIVRRLFFTSHDIRQNDRFTKEKYMQLTAKATPMTDEILVSGPSLAEASGPMTPSPMESG